MNKKNHFLFEIVILLVLWGFIEQITLTMIIIPVFWGAMFSDFDHQFKSHRNILFHSILPNVLVWIYNPNMDNIMFIISVVIHLLCDLLVMAKKQGGFSNIDIFGLKRLNTKLSALWFIVNILIGSMILIFGMI